MLQIVAMKIRLAFTAAILYCVSIVRGDEQLFGFVRGAETLPANRWEAYQFLTLGEGKSEGTYYGTHFKTEAEYGFTDQFQASLSLIQHYFYNKGVDGDRDALDNTNAYRFGGFEGSAKYRVLSPFKDPIGVALRLEAGYLLRDEVDGLDQHERYVKPEIDFQKDFLEDRLICAVDFGAEWVWGKEPAGNIRVLAVAMASVLAAVRLMIPLLPRTFFRRCSWCRLSICSELVCRRGNSHSMGISAFRPE